MPRNRILTCTLLACLTTVSACLPEDFFTRQTESTEIFRPSPLPTSQPLNGSWSGAAAIPELGPTPRLILLLQESGTDVTGTWELIEPDGAVLFTGTVSGTHQGEGVGLTLRRTGAAPVTAAGGMSYNGQALVVTVRAPGWTPTEVSLERQ